MTDLYAFERDDASKLKKFARTKLEGGGPVGGTEDVPRRMRGKVSVGLFKTPAGGIPAASGDGSAGNPYVWGSATCTEIQANGVVGTATETISNIVTDTIGGDVAIKAIKVGSIWVVDVASCP